MNSGCFRSQLKLVTDAYAVCWAGPAFCASVAPEGSACSENHKWVYLNKDTIDSSLCSAGEGDSHRETGIQNIMPYLPKSDTEKFIL